MSARFIRVGIQPNKELGPGRYALDQAGRLHPIELSKFVKAVCVVTVRAKEMPQLADMSAFVAASKAKPKPHVKQAAPRVIAQSREPCLRCGTPGFRGCAHQLPYQEWIAG